MGKISKTERNAGGATENKGSVQEDQPRSSGIEVAHLPILPQTSVRSERSGRIWKHPLTIEHTKPPTDIHHWSGQFDVKFPIEREIIQNTCEFLRDNTPSVYKQLYLALKITHPKDPAYPNRETRLSIEPLQESTETAGRKKPSQTGDDLRQLNFIFTPPKLGPSHWAYKRHQHPNRDTRLAPDDYKGRAKEAKAEAEDDTAAMSDYLKNYTKLFGYISGKNLCQATYGADVLAGPYLTCMEVTLEHLPRGAATQVLSFIHMGIGLQYMYERPHLIWDRPRIDSLDYKVLHESFKDAFRALARLFREDFGVK
jgi:hypothetical protein